jgi:hypothetical protein
MRLKFVLGMILMVALAFAGYTWQVQRLSNSMGVSSPGGLPEAVGVKMDLLTMASAEQQQLALEGKYLSLDELRAKGVALPERRGGYTFSADLTAGTFLIKATYKVPEGAQAPPELVIGPDMKVKELPAAAR